MRRTLVLVTLLCLVCSLAFGASAATYAKSVSIYATVSNDGTCQVTLTATLHLDQSVDNLRFPLPGKAGNITVNGARASSRVENGVRQVNLSRIIGKAMGDFTLNFTYSLPNLIVTNEAELLELQLPLLAGFAYPVQALEFSVSLPGAVTAKPAFSSGYHQANIEKDIYTTTTGATITGTSQVELKDHETLVMSLLVSEEMFPQKRIAPPNFQTVNILMGVFAALAVLYWILFLRNLPTWPVSRPTSPDGYNAGELGSVLHLQGGNLNMLVFSWAQLGYLLIQLDRNGRVSLHRQMDMGNERSAFEGKCFRLLFGKRDTVDAGSVRYAELYHTIARMKPNLSSFMHPKAGNLTVFQWLSAFVGMFCGVSVAIGLSTGALLQWLLVIVLGALAFFSSLHIQRWAVSLLAPDRRPVWIALGLCGAWLGLSAIAGLLPVGFGMVLSQLFAGLLSALGGRRTPYGRQAMGETLGLYRYLWSVSSEQLRQICQSNPEYYHQMAPYALALGVDKRFSKRFGKLLISQCPYISTGVEAELRATQWNGMMRRVLRGMNTRLPNGYLERMIAMIQRFIR
ncbi:MAG: DUF2207 domain-containing protein [Oscillospiraceae bacterium]|nr:DUF2207 domain-containing protein [Oscillospiraceae bacterium]